MVTAATLKLVRETKICDLMTSDRPAKRWEASGVPPAPQLRIVPRAASRRVRGWCRRTHQSAARLSMASLVRRSGSAFALECIAEPA